MAEEARVEKVALLELDRAAAKLEKATAYRQEVVAQAEAAVSDALQAHERALAAYARCAGFERAARLLGMEERDLRRLAKQLEP